MVDKIRTRYNLVAYPIHADVREAFYRLAEFYRVQSDGYCLRPEVAYPHVTLCQFFAASDDEAVSSTKTLCGRSLSVALSGIYVMPGVEPEHIGKFWSGYMVGRDETLIAAQSEVVSHLQAQGIECLTACGDKYFPHLTLTRSCAPLSEFDRSELFLPSIVGQKIEFRVCLGASDANGQLLEVLEG